MDTSVGRRNFMESTNRTGNTNLQCCRGRKVFYPLMLQGRLSLSTSERNFNFTARRGRTDNAKQWKNPTTKQDTPSSAFVLLTN